MAFDHLSTDLYSRERDQNGDRKFLRSWEIHKYSSLQLSQRKLFVSAHRGGVSWLDLDHVERRYLLSCAADASIAIYDTLCPSGSLFNTSHEALAVIKKQTPNSHQVAISTAIWYPVDNGIFLSGARDGDVKIWDANQLAVGGNFAIASPVHAISMSPTATKHCLLAVGSDEADVMLCDVVSGGFSHRLSGHRAPIWTVAWSPCNEHELISGGRDGQLRVWDIRRAGSLAVLDMHATRQKRASQQLGGTNPISSTTDVRLQVPGAQPASDLISRSHDGGLTGVVPTSDGLFWLSAGNDDAIRLWDASFYRHELVHYNGAFNRANKPRQLAVSDDGRVVFHPSGSAVQVFEIHSGQSVATLSGGHFESINSCVWNGVQEELYTGSNDHHIVVWGPKECSTLDPGEGTDAADKDNWSD